ncbi:hypothetical protein [Aeromicrobium choanae]|uniref:Uncharacterized protein n=1 Tax=Aeromicrobium choanae TaxID=1736691 RepID=A0A1T4Z575_9ACTN|nr:hypothetical protein [Aeromicrobium choanae]SKB09154.1 hypothetical protein SAMN06295964_2513 [Aeromicrobium choanae]
MTTSPDEPLHGSPLPDSPLHDGDPDLEPAAEPADAVDQRREVWENDDDLLVPDADRPVPVDEDEVD